MAHFADLSPYRYGFSEPDPGLLHVGWLSNDQPFARGVVSHAFFHALCRLAECPVELYRGTHVCNLCPPPRDIIAQDQLYFFVWASAREGNGEIRVSDSSGITYAAPVLIVHYIAEHQYRPPQEFVDAVLRWHEHSTPVA